jgi:predicted RNase H-like nuclease (RuvC/YqgF family)
MGRWAAIIIGILLAAAAGYVVGRQRPGGPSPQQQRIESRREETKSEVTTLREERQELQQRLEQVTKEQERLAQENEILRKQQVTDQILTGRGGELPALPLK